MNLGFDAKRLFLNRSGLGNYSRWLIKGLTEFYPENEYHLYTPSTSAGNESFEHDFASKQIHIHLPPNLFKSFWRTKGVKKDLIKDKIEIYHGLSNEIPFGIENTSVKSVVTIHDLIFKTHPEYYNTIDRSIYDKKFRSACERSLQIIAISQHTKDMIQNFYGIPGEKIQVIYMDALPIFHNSPNPLKLDEVKSKYLLNKPFFLNVGSGGRKNQIRLTEAFAAVASKIDFDLIFIGKKGKDSSEIEKIAQKYNLQQRIRWIEGISDEELYYFYHLSYATVYPSLYEGFGIPLIESFRCGKPVITSIGSSLEEVSGKSGLNCNPLDINDLSEKMINLTDKIVYQSLQVNIVDELLRFRPKNLIQEYQNMYKKLQSI